MAMTKKERAEFDAAILRANTIAALRWTEPVKKDVPVPMSFSKTVSGWLFNPHYLTASPAWTDSVSHGNGKEKNTYFASQNGVALFSTSLLALRALRHAVECESAEKLRKIDEKIAAEISSEESAVEA